MIRHRVFPRLALAVVALHAAAACTQSDASPPPVLESPPINQPAPAFTVSDTKGTTHSLADYRGKWVVLEWFNHGCPYTKKHYKTDNMQALQRA